MPKIGMGINNNFFIMKTLQKLKLAQLSREELSKKELNKIRGGGCCICSCGGPSGIVENAGANNSGSLYSPGGGVGTGSYG